MNEQIDWSKAPEGTTHYVVGSIHPFEKRVGDDWFYYVEGAWSRIHIKGDDRITSSALDVVPRPTTPSWSGEGLPPVGVVCEVRNAPGGWGKATIKYQGKGIIVWLWDRPDGNTDQIEFASCPDRLEFRPIRTPEQIESSARIEAAQEWLKSIELEYGEDAADQCESILMAAESKRMAKL